MSIETASRSTGVHASSLASGEGAGTPAQTLALLREWSSVVDSVAAGQTHLLIRKGGIAEGKEGFQVRRSFFGLLPTLFHQVKSADPAADAPAPPATVSILAQLVECYSVPSTVLIQSIKTFHGYSDDQLTTRQSYKPERPLNLMIVRAFRLRSALNILPGQVRAVCRSWAEVPLASGLGGIDPVLDIERSSVEIAELQAAITALAGAERIG